MPHDLHADILLVTATKIETKAVLEVFTSAGHSNRPHSVDGRVYFDLGTVNDAHVRMTQCEMGPGGLGAALQSVSKGIAALAPAAVIMVGIAFGVNEEKQSIGDILVTEALRLYDLQRVGTNEEQDVEIVLRGDKPHASPWLLNLFRSSETAWSGATVRFGTVLTGAKLVDNLDFRKQLCVFEPEAIGGEMEGAGLYVACHDRKVDWILVKAICDFADGKKAENKTERQATAARNAAVFVRHALSFATVDWRSQAPNRGPDVHPASEVHTSSATPAARMKEFVGILDDRATHIADAAHAKMRTCEPAIATAVETQLQSFRKLHQLHTAHLSKGELIRAHEVLGDIYRVLFTMSHLLEPTKKGEIGKYLMGPPASSASGSPVRFYLTGARSRSGEWHVSGGHESMLLSDNPNGAKRLYQTLLWLALEASSHTRDPSVGSRHGDDDHDEHT